MQDPSEKRKGRPAGTSKKKKGFRGIMKKQQIEMNHQSRDPYKPTGLENKGANICFFNSVTQILYHIPELYHDVMTSTFNNEFTREMQVLFQKMDTASKSGQD